MNATLAIIEQGLNVPCATLVVQHAQAFQVIVYHVLQMQILILIINVYAMHIIFGIQISVLLVIVYAFLVQEVVLSNVPSVLVLLSHILDYV